MKCPTTCLFAWIALMIGYSNAAFGEEYRNEAVGYALTVPTGWQVAPAPNKLSARLVAPQKQGDALPGKVALLGEQLAGSGVRTVREYATRCRDNLKALMPKAVFTDFKEVKLGGRDAMSYSLTWDTPDLGQVAILQVITIVGDKGLVITYQDDAADYKQLLPDVQKGLDSLKFTGEK